MTFTANPSRRNGSKSRLLLAGAMALGLAGYLPATTGLGLHPTAARADDDGYRESRFDYNDLPGRVMDSVDNNLTRGTRLGEITHVRGNGKDFYRVNITQRDGDRKTLFIDRDGQFLTERDTASLNTRAGQAARAAEARDTRDTRIDDRSRPTYYRDEAITASVNNPQRVTWDQIPPRVRATMGREAEGEKIDFVVAYRDNGRVIYQTNLSDGPGRSRLIQVTPDGSLFGDASVSNGGRGEPRYSTQRTIDLRDVPREARRAIEDQAHGRADGAKIISSSRRGRTFYTAQFPTDRGGRWITVDDSGKILSDVLDQGNGDVRDIRR